MGACAVNAYFRTTALFLVVVFSTPLALGQQTNADCIQDTDELFAPPPVPQFMLKKASEPLTQAEMLRQVREAEERAGLRPKLSGTSDAPQKSPPCKAPSAPESGKVPQAKN